MITDYDIAVEADVQALAQGVRRQMQKGWKPYGPPFLDRTGSLCQALVIRAMPVPQDWPNTPVGTDDVWGEHPRYPRQDWAAEVANNDTNLGYWMWVRSRIDQDLPQEAGNA